MDVEGQHHPRLDLLELVEFRPRHQVGIEIRGEILVEDFALTHLVACLLEEVEVVVVLALLVLSGKRGGERESKAEISKCLGFYKRSSKQFALFRLVLGAMKRKGGTEGGGGGGGCGTVRAGAPHVQHCVGWERKGR